MAKSVPTPPSDRVYKIGISGSYGGLNLGDEAILQSIVSQLVCRESATEVSPLMGVSPTLDPSFSS